LSFYWISSRVGAATSEGFSSLALIEGSFVAEELSLIWISKAIGVFCCSMEICLLISDYYLIENQTFAAFK
jgi:hypothetical protein